MTINIISNGSKWAGEHPDPLCKWLETLASTPLDGTFFDERYWFLSHDGDTYHIHGNFARVSHVFHFVTTDAEEALELTLAILDNRARFGEQYR